VVFAAIRPALRRALASVLTGAFLLAPLPAPRVAAAAGPITDDASYPPPTSGAYAYYSTYGTFGPTNSGFPGVGDSYVDPVFGSTIRRLTNDVGRASNSENYAKNGYFNADGTLVHHRGPDKRQFIDTRTGQVVRSGVPGTGDGSFAPDDPDTWYYFAEGSANLMKYSVKGGTSSTVKTFPGALEDLGRSVDFIDRTGRYFVLKISGAIRVWDKQTDTLFSGSIPGSYKGSGGWVGISPDGKYVVTTRDPKEKWSFAVDLAGQRVETSGTLFWTLCGDHGDLISASNGKTYMVTYNCASSPSLYAVDVTLPQTAGNVSKQTSENKKLVQLSSWTDTNGHFSAASKGALQDWAFADIESHDDTFSATVSSWRPYKQEIFMMNVVTGEVRRLAHHRSRNIGSSYYYQPRISVSWDGGLVGFISNMGYSASGYSDLYVVEVPGADQAPAPDPEPTPEPDPTPTPLNVTFSNPASGATVSGTVTVSVGATGGDGGYTYTVKAGTATIYSGTNGSFSWNTTATPNGDVTLNATANDASQSGTTTRSVKVANTTSGSGGGSGTGDTTAPTAKITSPSGNVWTGSSINISASATDNAALKAIELWGAGKAFATLPCSGTSCSGSYRWSTSSLSTGAYQVHAVAVDAAGNRTLSSPILVYKNGTSPLIASGATGGTAPAPEPTPTPTPTPLTVAVTSPAAGATVTGTTSVGFTTTGASGSLTVAPTVDGAALPTQTVSGTGGTVSIDTTKYANGSHTIGLKVTDGAGKTANASVTVTVSNTTTGGGTGDTTAPTVKITSPSGNVWTGSSILIAASATDNVKLKAIELWGAGKMFANVPCPLATCSASTRWSTSSLATGAYQVHAVAVDAAGNRTLSSPILVYKNGTSPLVASGATGGSAPAPAPAPEPTPEPTAPLTVAFTSPASGATVSGTTSVAFATTGASGSLTVVPSVDGAALPTQTASGSGGTVSIDTKKYANGGHTIGLNVTDGAGKTASASLAVTVSNTVASGDTTAPTVTITSPSSGVWTGSSIVVGASATDNAALARIELWGGGQVFATLACSGTSCSGSDRWSTGSLPNGALVVNAVAVDAAGNRTVSAPVTIYHNAKSPTIASGAK
jgi:hypothetical protein